MPDGPLRKAEEIFERAAELHGDARRAFLDEACGDDAAVRRDVESLLTADESAGDFLEQPVVRHGMNLAAPGMPTGSAGEIVGSYKLLRKIGAGGMSEVYLAVRADDAYQKRVALKVIRHDLDREDMLRRFRTERQILAGLDHPNIATLLDGGSTDDGLPYYVMDYIDGQPIDEYCDTQRLTVRQRLELFRTVCSAVQFAHQNLVIHRDIKASNIVVTPDGTAKLLDFGIAKLLKPDVFAEQVEYTATWARPMTPRYASPEQVQGKPVTTATDVYSLGVLLYKLLTGHLPYRLEENRPDELGRLVVEQDPERPSTIVTRVESGSTLDAPDGPITPEVVGKLRATQPHQLQRQLSGDLDNILLMTLRKEPQRRYASVERFSEDIRNYLRGHPVQARADTFGYRTTKFVRRNWIGVGVAAAFVALLAGFGVTMAIQASSIARERDQVSLERDRAEKVVSFMKEIFALSDPMSPTAEDVTAREILHRGARRVRDELKGQPVVQASLMDAIGGVYRNLGMYKEARPLFEDALEIRRRVFGEPHEAVAESLLNLGLLEHLAGNLELGESLLRASLEASRSLLGSEDPVLGNTLNVLGIVLRLEGKFEEAESLYRESIRILEVGGEPEELLTARANLATLLVNLGRPAEAEPLFREVLDRRRELLHPRHPNLAQTLGNLGTTLGMQGKYDEAEPVLREALELHREIFDPDHPVLLESLNNFGKLMQRKGNPAAAIPLYQEALTIGADNIRVGHIYGNLGEAYRDLGDLAESERHLRSSLAARQRVHGDEHPDVARSLLAVADVMVADGRATQAEPLARQGLAVLEASLPDHWWTANGRSILGGCLFSTDRVDEAEPLLVAGYEALEQGPGPHHPATRDARARLATLYETSGRPELAAALR